MKRPASIVLAADELSRIKLPPAVIAADRRRHPPRNLGVGEAGRSLLRGPVHAAALLVRSVHYAGNLLLDQRIVMASKDLDRPQIARPSKPHLNIGARPLIQRSRPEHAGQEVLGRRCRSRRLLGIPVRAIRTATARCGPRAPRLCRPSRYCAQSQATVLRLKASAATLPEG